MADARKRSVDETIGGEAPTFYANSVGLGISAYDLTLMFGQQIGENREPQARIIMSIEHAMVMTMIMRRSLREHVKSTGVNPTVPEAVMRDLQLTEEEPLW